MLNSIFESYGTTDAAAVERGWRLFPQTPPGIMWRSSIARRVKRA